MTKIPSVVEVVEAIRQRHIHLKANNPVGFVHLFADIKKALTADRLALLTELEESIQTIDFYGWNEQTQSKIKEKVQAHLDELIKSNRLELDNP